MKTFKHILFITNLLFLFLTPSWAETSLIDSVMQSKQCVVTVRAVRSEIRPSPSGTARMMTLEKVGAGVIIDPEGFIVTNYHTIKYADELGVRLYNGAAVGAKIVYMEPDQDLALIQIEPPSALSAVNFADSNNVKLDDNVVNIGHSDAKNQMLSGGKVIGLGQMKSDPNGGIELIEVNIDLDQGDSGGPLFDDHGRLIGMIAAELKNERKATFAIPSNKIKKLYFDFRKKGYNR